MAEVKGLALFAEHFRDWRAHYVLIGGVASNISMEEAGLDFRTTKDLDIVLVVEVLSPEFVSHFWDFIKQGTMKFARKVTRSPIVIVLLNPRILTIPFSWNSFHACHRD